MNFKLICTHTYYQFIEMFRNPIWLTSTLLFPSMFFWFFGVPNADTADKAKMLTGSFSVFACLGVVVFQFGVTIAEERSRPWYDYVRTLPMPKPTIIIAKIFSGFIFASLTVILVFATSYLFCKTMAWSTFPFENFVIALLIGAIPFGFLGLCIGLLCNPKSAVPVANLIYLPLSFAGGLWLPPNALPKEIQKVSEYLPTRYYGEVIWKTLFHNEIEKNIIIGLLVYTLIFTVTAFVAWNKQEVSRYK